MALYPSASFAAEFPNDNSDLHAGTIWMAEELCGGAMPHFSEWVDPAPEEPIEIVESIELEGPIEEVPAPPPPAIEATPEVLALAPAPVELAPEPHETIPAPLESGIVASAPHAHEDPYGVFLQTLSDVACASGHVFGVTEIASALAGDAVARAWCAILRGESEDFTLCGTPLDEWAGAVLARVVLAPHKAAQLRRDLRAHGVAAFGLIEAA